MRPFSVVQDVRFKKLVNMLEPKYKIPSRPHFSQKVLPKLYNETKQKVTQRLEDVDTIAITTDGWTSRATESYITITAHGITSDWEMVNFVLQTCPLYESHTGLNIGEVITTVVDEWNLKRANRDIAIVTDNVRNMDVAVREAGV